jgi:hypothetical protein
MEKSHPSTWMTRGAGFQTTYLSTMKWYGTGKGKGKFIPVPFFNWTPRHEGVLGEWRYRSAHSLTSGLDGGEWTASRPGRFTSRERAPSTHWIGGWVGSRAVLDAVSKRKISYPRRDSNPDHPIFQPVVSRYTDWAIPTLGIGLYIQKRVTESYVSPNWSL